MSEIGLFPLGIVLLPTEEVPLHIFEERYKELIGECLSGDQEFGLVYADDDGIRDVGTRARVIRVLAQFEDGRMNVVVQGRERFTLVELTDGRSFQTGQIAPLEDEEDPAETSTVERALELFDHLREVTQSEVETPGPETAQLSFALASRVELAAAVKLELLQQVSERHRLERVCELLAGAAATVERQRRVAERAATNGKFDLS